MKYRILLVLAVLSAASPIAADSIEEINTNSTTNISSDNTIYMASSGGETALGSALSEEGEIFTAEAANGTKVSQLSSEGHYRDIEILNNSQIAYTYREFTSKGLKSSIIFYNTTNRSQIRNITAENSVNDLEIVNEKIFISNTTSIHRAGEPDEKLVNLNLSEDREINNFEARGDTTFISLSNPGKLVVFRNDQRTEYNMSEASDIQIIDTSPVKILAVHDEKASEYIARENLSEVWSYRGLDQGLAVSRLENNETIISDSSEVLAVNSTGSEIWSMEKSDISDIEHRSEKVYSLEGKVQSEEAESYWTPSSTAESRDEEGFIEGIVARINSFFN
ncbi:hypothetical protein [Candidatus Nanohalovita haloferacivicina]|uniref:hypothetical protein n=1 Tax=Candidatus Nanohalovita haloferacivicina TaxID=2978046 RepID=UPI00325FDD78|nr:hypothetical protein HBNXNv_1025 [Candidatus Nanohalobia archaeon BNXNv]